jgi:hypothetical protein
MNTSNVPGLRDTAAGVALTTPPRLANPPHPAPKNSLRYNASSVPTTNAEIPPGYRDVTAGPNPTGVAGGVIVVPSSTCAAESAMNSAAMGAPRTLRWTPSGPTQDGCAAL